MWPSNSDIRAVSVLCLELVMMRRDVQRWQSVIRGNIGQSGASPNRVQQTHDVATFAFLSLFHHSSFFSSFYYFNSDFYYIDMHPTLAGLYPFLLGSPARCTFLSYFMCIYYLKSPVRSRLSRSHNCPNRVGLRNKQKEEIARGDGVLK